MYSLSYLQNGTSSKPNSPIVKLLLSDEYIISVKRSEKWLLHQLVFLQKQTLVDFMVFKNITD